MYGGNGLSLAFDIILVSIFVVNIISGYHKGLILKIYDIISFFFVIIVAFALVNPVASWISSTKVYENVLGDVKENVKEKFVKDGEESDIGEMFKTDSEELSKILGHFNIDYDEANEKFGELVNDGKENANDAFFDYIVTPIAKTIVKIIAFIAVLIAAIIITVIVRLLLVLLSKIPVLKGVNKTLGAVIGAVYGLILIYTLSNLFCYAVPYFSYVGIHISPEAISNTYILKALTGIDLLDKIL